MTDLLTLAREHDLPPRWDGRIVTWTDWVPQLPAFVCPPPALADTCCQRCGSLAASVTCKGLVALSPRTTQEDLEYEEENRRRLKSLAGKRPHLALFRLYAFRCPDCKHDQVWDTDTNDFWDLDPSDYGDDGSSPPDPEPPPAPAPPKTPKPTDHSAGAAACRAQIAEGLW